MDLSLPNLCSLRLQTQALNLETMQTDIIHALSPRYGRLYGMVQQERALRGVFAPRDHIRGFRCDCKKTRRVQS